MSGVKRRGRGLNLYGQLPVWFHSGGPSSDVVISTRVRLARNLEGRKFPRFAPAREKQRVFGEVSAVMASVPPRLFGSEFEIVKFGRLRALEQQFLIEERLVSVDLLHAEGERGVASENQRRVSVMINEEDHLRLQGMDSGFRTFEIFHQIDRLDDYIGRYLKYAYDGRLGFLTSCPTNCGTGLRVSCLLHLPGLVLTKTVDAVLQGASQMGVSTRGFFGENSEIAGNFFQLSNQATMGAREEEFIESTEKVIREVVSHERKARERLLRDAHLELSDKVFRSLGILTHARTLSFTELLNLTSALRLGAECGIYGEINAEEINKMIMICMPAHLHIHRSLEEVEMDLDISRANLVRNLLTKKKRSKGVR
ncbi:MAG: ATP--guanido phosphotransferase [Chitinispirillia bacterium]|nr:ATP--guanido phosphotransferase [Chitinispirillia bacterium]